MNYNTTIQYIKGVIGDFAPKLGVILGSGLGNFAQSVEPQYAIEYGDIPHFPLSSVEGHRGRLLFGYVEGVAVMVMEGRFHYYEGYSSNEITYPIRVMKLLGVEILLLSNAAGALNPNYRVGDIVILNNHINLIPNPLIGKNDERFGERFPEMKHPYSQRLIELADSITTLQQGVYVGLTGPSLESSAEVSYLRLIGGDMVGMSTTPETIVARHCSMEVFAVSVITNSTSTETSHQEVVEQGNRASKRLSSLFVEMISRSIDKTT